MKQCESRIYWPGGVRCRCGRDEHSDDQHSNGTFEWTTAEAAAGPPKYHRAGSGEKG